MMSQIQAAYYRFRRDRTLRRIARRNAHNPDAIFLWVPKTAGTSLFSVLKDHNAQELTNVADVQRYLKNRGTVTFGHLGLNQLLHAQLVSPDFVRRAWKFAFVRNPYDRAVSLFEYLRGTTKDLPEKTTFEIFCQYLAAGAYREVGLYNHEGLNQLNPQAAWLHDDTNGLWPDFLGRFEQFDTDVRVVWDRLGLRSQGSEKAKVNASSRREISDYYGQEQIEIVRHVYRADFELFGYDTAPFWRPLKAG
jgi:hypothetical protein